MSRSTVVRERPRSAPQPPQGGAAGALAPLLEELVGSAPLRIEFWDGTGHGPRGAVATLRIRSATALRRLLWAPGELGLARAFVEGDVELDGDLFEAIRELRPAGMKLRSTARLVAALAATAAKHLDLIGPPPPAPAVEARPHGRLHSLHRDAEAVRHHYDVGNEFYAHVLGPSMTYSCARFATPDLSLAEAQASKHELVCRKLGLHERPGARLLDVGCGWGSMALHAAQHHGAEVVGVTLSPQQLAWARRRVADAGLTDRIELCLLDYRHLVGERFDAISSIGMFEHVGGARVAEYFTTLRALLRAEGRLLNHAISSVGGSRPGPRSFVGRYVFPDGELHDVGDTVLAMERAGFEVRDVESLREHYGQTLRCWVANLERHWGEAVALVGAPRARVWRLYMAASAVGFEDGGLGLHQVLGVVPSPTGESGMPSTRHGWTT